MRENGEQRAHHKHKRNNAACFSSTLQFMTKDVDIRVSWFVGPFLSCRASLGGFVLLVLVGDALLIPS